MAQDFIRYDVLVQDALRGVLHHDEPVLARERHDRVHVATDARVVHRHDGPGLGGDLGAHARRVETEAVRQNVGEHRRGAGHRDREARVGRRHGWYDHLVAWSNAQPPEQEHERIGTVTHTHGMRHP